MKVLNSLLMIVTLGASLVAAAQDYSFAVLKSGVKQDLEQLIDNPNNFVRENDHVFGGSMLYLKHTSSTANTFRQYGVANNHQHDSRNISSVADLISVGESFDSYFQCVQFVRALSNAGHTSKWKWSGAKLNSSMYLKWRIIAKFKSDGTYWQPGDSGAPGHVAIALGSNANGVYVIDQNWEGNGYSTYGKVAVHLIPWSEASKYSLLTIPKG
ncbi:BPSL0067 family protein [Pseudoalteromonas umbrosa]|uniref:BPSL0067 family protein n=1 Tax=Pseudoalteromonas umbrosa TaxID=3048489 RepID=UPI0024C2977C|nr:BPSL0067 family protein [Pseudoalteromonas sp. B95]MDK1286776.1 BPSL0067 family protein [Pseudoalteromonas sp. B95]